MSSWIGSPHTFTHHHYRFMEITSRLAPSSVHEGTIDARIANYLTLPNKIGVDIVSPFVELGMYKWAVKVSPIGQIAAHDDHVGCYLVSGNDSDLTGSATSCLIDGGGTKRFVQSFQDTEMLKGNAGWGFRKMVSVAELMLESTNLLVDDALRIRVEIHKVAGGLHTPVHFLDDSHYVYGGYSASSFIQSNCESRDAVFPCDVYIRTNSGPAKAEETEIAAHKYMLAVHSPVLRHQQSGTALDATPYLATLKQRLLLDAAPLASTTAPATQTDSTKQRGATTTLASALKVHNSVTFAGRHCAVVTAEAIYVVDLFKVSLCTLILFPRRFSIQTIRRSTFSLTRRVPCAIQCPPGVHQRRGLCPGQRLHQHHPGLCDRPGRRAAQHRVVRRHREANCHLHAAQRP
jgi:hypothetical protein